MNPLVLSILEGAILPQVNTATIAGSAPQQEITNPPQQQQGEIFSQLLSVSIASFLLGSFMQQQQQQMTLPLPGLVPGSTPGVSSSIPTTALPSAAADTDNRSQVVVDRNTNIPSALPSSAPGGESSAYPEEKTDNGNDGLI